MPGRSSLLRPGNCGRSSALAHHVLLVGPLALAEFELLDLAGGRAGEFLHELHLAGVFVLGEAVQTVLRREGHTDAYERVKDLTRGESVTLDDFHDLFADLDVPAEVREELQALTPAGYTGIAAEMVDDIPADE